MLATVNRDLLPFGLKPGYDGYYAGGHVSVEADGNRRVVPTCDQGTTLLLIGDSVAFGQGLDDDQTIASRLQKRLCGSYQVKNLAAPGYSSWNEYAAFRDYPKHVDELLLIYVPNDVTFNDDHFDLRHKPLGELADDRTHRVLMFFYSHVYLAALVSDGVKRLMKTSERNWIYADGDNAAMTYSMRALEQLRDLCSQKNIKFSVAVYRDVWYYSQPVEAERYEDLIVNNLQKRSIHNFVLKSHIDRLTLGEARLAWNDPHPSARAIPFIVDDLIKYLAK